MHSNSYNFRRHNIGVELILVPNDVEIPVVFKTPSSDLYWLKSYSRLKRVLYFHHVPNPDLPPVTAKLPLQYIIFYFFLLYNIV